MKKSERELAYDISSIKRVTKKFLEVVRCSRIKQRQRNAQKKCAARAKLLFLLIRTIVVFHRCPALPSLCCAKNRRCELSRVTSPLALHDFMFCLDTL